MSLPSSILGPAVGAFISGLIGIATVEYRNHRDELTELANWHDQTIRLAEQVEHETPDPALAWVRGEAPRSTVDEGVFPARENDMTAEYGKLGERLREQVYFAPQQVNEEIIENASETARLCRILDREISINEDDDLMDLLPTVKMAVESANILKEKSEDNKKDIGFF